MNQDPSPSWDPLRHLGGVAVAVALLGLCATLWGAQRSVQLGKELLKETSAVVGRTRDLDKAALHCRGDQAERASATAILEDALAGATIQKEKDLLRAAVACVSQEDCVACLGPTLDQAEEAFAAPLTAAWQLANTAATHTAWAMGLGVMACLLSILVLALMRLPRAQVHHASNFPAAEPPPAAGQAQSKEGLEELLRARLDELYAARLKEVQNDRFAYFGEAAAGLSHGLKTPLAGIRAAATVALAKLGPNHAAVANLGDIVSEVDTLSSQVNQFLASTRVGMPALAQVTAAQLLDGLQERYAAAAANQGVHLIIEPSLAPDLHVQADLGLIHMALGNLLDNALWSAPRGSSVAVRVQVATPPARAGVEDAPVGPGGAWLEVAVEDDGAGISPRAASGESVTSTKPLGSGLGVAISRRIVARHGGALHFEAKPGQGTRARVLLPQASSGGAA